MTTADQRQFRRVGCEIPSRLKKVDEAGPNDLKTQILDISEGGVRFRFSRPISSADRFYISLEISHKTTIEANVQLVWTHRVPRSGEYEAGASFIYLSPQDKQLIHDFVTGKL